MKKNKLLIPIMVLILVIGVVGGTLAWLTAQTQEVTNTFTVGNIDITLEETDASDTDDDGIPDSKEYKMVPGTTLDKDPKVTVEAGSEDCWLFVTVKENIGDVDDYTFSDYIGYNVNLGEDDWTQLTDNNENPITKDGAYVYYREVGASDEGQTFYVINDGLDPATANEVYVKGTITKDMMDALCNENGEPIAAKLPTLSFKAYAVQKEGFDTAAEAWAEASK